MTESLLILLLYLRKLRHRGVKGLSKVRQLVNAGGATFDPS